MTSAPSQSRRLTRATPDQEQEAELRPLSLSIIRRLLGFTRPHAAKRNWLLFCVILRAVQTTTLAWATAAVLEGPVVRHDFDATVLGAAGFLALAAFTYITFHFRQRLALELGEAVVYDLRSMLFEHLQRMPMRFYDRTKLGRIISRFTSDVENLRAGVQDVLFVTLTGGGQMLLAAGLMLYYDAVLFGLVLVMAPVIWAMNRYFQRRLSRAHRNVQESMSRVTSTIAESVSGIRVTQGFVRQDVNAAMFRDLVEDHSEHNLDAARTAGLFLPLLELNSQFFISMLLLVGGYQVLSGNLSIGHTQTEQFEAVWYFFFMVPMFFSPIAHLGQQYNQALAAMAGAERVFTLLDRKPEMLDSEGARPLPRIEGRVELVDVNFSYVPDKPVLKDLSFLAKPGQTIALVGHTGCGKTSIVNLIAKFYLPTTGKVLIDGHDTAHVQTESLARQLGIVIQENFLFTGTVIDNIRVGRPEATDEEVVEAARKLDVLDLLESMPEGLYTEVGERGQGMSLGQRQVVCFTRAMVADPRILMLDEATSSVDTMTEARIQKALQKLLEGRTSFVVAHRLSTIRHASMVLVLDHGRIIERGTHNQLLATGGVYANLYRQFINASEA